ncbi:serine hydrolase [Actinomadura sp. NEAU-AAG7]|uniref:serine hydrolase domain-containing protein n=1 Tax=Actinomadura sp. NEAU-AAG7 TaxID=2839640 RepID=UPI001BE44D06|nr:serine hydrolase domain-containing protein [Actinomadura sp. NEAU-AAG7]MBT2212703.1 beta-lactamase family protein [Actinomadura sp. NEAU-AAG7]
MLLRLFLAAAVTLGAAPAAPASASPDPHGRLQRDLDGMVRDVGAPGALLSVTGTRTFTLRSGTGDLRTGRPVPVNGRVRIGSTTKAFVATVVLQLVGERRVRLDAPVETYLPGAVRGRGGDGRTITVRQLLQHTSHLPDPGPLLPHGREWADQRFRHRDRDELLRYALAQEPTTGSWSYNNTGYLLLGRLIEAVTGARTWRDEVAGRIARPLRLRNTYAPGPYSYRIGGPHPRGYVRVPEYVDVTEQDTGYLDAAGAMVSTPAEVNRFFSALLRGRLLRPAELAEMRRVLPAGGTVDAYGLGLEVNHLSCGDLVGHAGQMHGYSTVAGVLVDRRGRPGAAVTMSMTTEPEDMDDFRRAMHVIDTALCG